MERISRHTRSAVGGGKYGDHIMTGRVDAIGILPTDIQVWNSSRVTSATVESGEVVAARRPAQSAMDNLDRPTVPADAIFNNFNVHGKGVFNRKWQAVRVFLLRT